MKGQHSAAYQRIEELIASERCAILDGGVTTELQHVGPKEHRVSDKGLWGTGVLYREPYAALEVHKRYVAAGCDIISTITWAIMDAQVMETQRMVEHSALRHWMDVARLGIMLARQAVDEGGRSGECAVAFSLNGDVVDPQSLHRIQLLARVFKEDPPDLILLETMSLVREDLTEPAVEIMLETGLPVWLSFRRCRHGVCGIHGQHWGGPEGDLFGRQARHFEEMGVGALLINCLPLDHVSGMISWLRDFTEMPLGAYPNLGRYLDPGWKFDDEVGPEEYANLALQWRQEGAQIVGGCCGVTPEHMAVVGARLASTKPGNRNIAAAHPLAGPAAASQHLEPPARKLEPWIDANSRVLYPLPLPEIVCDPGVFPPTQGSFLMWKYLWQSGTTTGKRCLDVGCGTGILSVQLALSGAQHVDAIDIQPQAVANLLTNAFRNGVAERVSGKVADLYSYIPEERYEVVVASLYQMPVDPMGETTSHRPVDFWGRNLLDHLISLLPDMLEEDGVAYVMQISVLGQLRTLELLERSGFLCKVIDFSLFHFGPVFQENIEQIRRVEELSDAYHLTFGEDEVMVMYLLEIRSRKN